MRHVFLMDPLETVAIDKDSTFAMMCEAQKRGHTVLYALVDQLYSSGDRARTTAREATLRRVQGDHFSLGPEQEIDLGDADVVWMRKDPPFHIDYVFNTYLLDLAAQATLVVNHPDGLRAMNEKTWAMRFAELVPESMITSSVARIREFIEAQGVAVVKPLDGNGGEGVFVVRRDDPNVGVICELSTKHGARKVLTQRYLPEAKVGDKRIILIEGQPVGAILRVPQGIDHRGNMHAGAIVEKTTLTARERTICDQIGPPLRAAGQVFVGIDVIGDYLTEVNVTSPTGIHEINALDGVCLEAQLLDAVERRRAALC